MIKERFQELSAQLNALRKESEKTADTRERRSLLKQMRTVIKEIDELIRNQTQAYLTAASNDSKGT
jgi:hypothetical protein